MIDDYKHKGQRRRLVEKLTTRGITDERVLAAIGEVPRHFFVPGGLEAEAYTDKALPIDAGQTISQPFTVAFQSELLQAKPKMKVLEIGTGSGYQAAVLVAMGLRVFSVEFEPQLHRQAMERLADLGAKVYLHLGDGSQGWPQYQPYERILVTAASPSVPEALKQQLEIGGRLVLPVGSRSKQRMGVITRLDRREYQTEYLSRFQFVPLRGRYGFEEE